MNRPRRELRSDGEATRARILEAAGELSTVNGFAGASNKAIAARANVDMASINYHFGNRDGLYRAVLAKAHHRLMDLTDLQQLSEINLPVTTKLRSLIEQFVTLSRAEPKP